jgi:hypothetical protein
MTYAPTVVPTTSKPTSVPTGTENVYVCVGANVSMGFIESVFLYDLTSRRAIREGIAQSTGIPYADVTYDKDVSQLCPVEGGNIVQSETIRPNIHASGNEIANYRRVLVEETTLNFAIRKPILQPTYEYTVDELALELENRILNAMETGAFSLDILAAVELYNATLLQTNDFKAVMANPSVKFFFRRIIQHLFSPTSMPSVTPSVDMSVNSVIVSNAEFTIGASILAGLCLFCVICCLIFCVCKKNKDKRAAIYAVGEEESLQKSEEAKEECDRQAQMGTGLLLRRESKDSCVSALSFPGINVSTNRCFLFLKPHADRESVRSFVSEFLTSRQFKIVSEGIISPDILLDCVDKQYDDLRRKALVLAPRECTLSSISMMAFEQKFRISWSVAVKKKLVQNAREACDILGVTHSEMRKAWMDCIRLNKMVKLGRDFYCGYIDTILNKPAVFCINGFYMSMRDEYSVPDASVYYYCVEWDNALTSWKDFRKRIVGDGDPLTAHPESLRAVINNNWKDLGLATALDMTRNGIHCSASAFEALVECTEWLKVSIENDSFGDQLIRNGITLDELINWMSNVSVNGKPVFDHMENKGSRECVETAKQLLQVSVKGKDFVCILHYVHFSSS